MSSVLVYENSLSGHRGLYVAILAEELIRLGLQVTLALPANALDQTEGQVFLANTMQRCEVLPQACISIANPSGLSFAKAKLSQLVQATKHKQFQRCYVPYADGLTQGWGAKLLPKQVLPSELPIEGLMMRGGFAYPQPSVRRKWAALISKRLQLRSNLSVIHQLDPMPFYAMQPSANNRIRLMPEFIDQEPDFDQHQSKADFGIEPDTHLIVCPGAVNENKGAHLLIEAIHQPQAEKHLHLLLVGKHSSAVLQRLSRFPNSKRVTSINRFATANEFSKLFAAADTVAVCYLRHIGSSSILLRAAKSRKQILASNWGWIGWATNTFELGKTCNASSIDDIVASLNQLANQSEKSGANDLRFKPKTFLDYHSKENHCAHWSDELCKQLGLPAKPKTSFTSVLQAVKAKPPNLLAS